MHRIGNKKFFYELILLTILCIIGAYTAYIQGKDGTWDLANYHFYGVYAFLNGRIGFDIMPGGVISYMNPILDFPLFFAIKYLNNYPILISCLTGTLWGIMVFLLYKFTSMVFTKKHRTFLIAISTLIGATGAMSIFSCGLSCNDIPICIIALVAIYVLFKHLWLEDSISRNLWVLLSGFLFGAASGLKYVSVYFILSIVGVLIVDYVFGSSIKKPLKILLFFVLGAVIGFSVTGLWWAVLLYKKFGNPFFPKLNNIFQSPLALPINYADERHYCDRNNLLEFIFFPFYGSWYNAFEYWNVDFRQRVLYISCLFLIGTAIFAKINPKCINNLENYIDMKKVFFLNFMLLIGYIIWINTTSYTRYLLFYELFAGILIVSTVLTVFQKLTFSLKKDLIFLLCIFFAATTQYVESEVYRASFSQKYIDAPDLKIPDNSIVLELGGWPPVYFIPFNNPNVRWIYLWGEMETFAFKYPHEQEERLKEIINAHKGRTYLIYSETPFTYVGWEYAAQFINKDDFVCKDMPQNSFTPVVEKFYFCSPK